jgi:hypothetical protein
MKIEFRQGVTMIDDAAAGGVIEAARDADVRVFILDTSDQSGREAFFDAVRSVMPLDPPLLSSRSWDALSDSAWEGIRRLDSANVAIVWTGATTYRKTAGAEYDKAIAILRDLADSLADSKLTGRRPKILSVFVGHSGNDGDV